MRCQRCGKDAPVLLLTAQLRDVCPDCFKAVNSPKVARHIADNMERRNIATAKTGLGILRAKQRPPEASEP